MTCALSRLILFLMVLCGAATMQGATVLGNGTNTSATPLQVGSYVISTTPFLFTGNTQAAMAFTTGTEAVNLESLTLSMAGGGSGTEFPVAIREDFANAPNILSGFGLTGEQSPTTAGVYQYTPFVPQTLAAGTTYWLVLGFINGSSTLSNYFVDTTTDTSFVSPSGWTMGSQILTSAGAPLNPWISQPNQALKFSIQASVAPEPSRILLCLAGVMILFLRRRR
jgi:hypothetical protein